MTEISEDGKVIIVGGGFAGMNAARILSKNEIKCEIFTSGFGASNLWVGTIDLLKSQTNDLEKEFNQFKKDIPNHPYKYLNFKEVNEAISNLSLDFPDLYLFKKNNKITNDKVLTIIGNLKPCVGVWDTIFHDTNSFDDNKTTILIDFIEFNNSAMDLVEIGLKERYKGKFKVLTLSFTELLKRWNPHSNDSLPKKLSENLIANYFDNHFDNNAILGNYILSELKNQDIEISRSEIWCYLFPPVLGIKYNLNIMDTISKELNAKCAELVALSPSLMAKRIIQKFEKYLEDLTVKINKGYTLSEIGKILERNEVLWNLTFQNRAGQKKIVKSKYMILAIGSLFQEGLFYSHRTIKNNFNEISIPYPNKMTNSYEILINSEIIKNSNIFVCGSALYTLMGEMSDEEEIKYGTGLGLAIATSSKVANEIINRIQ
jgi:anaerobic glycerol-3-phosphate dehydrogenase